jgi:hypothetical protein
MRTDDNRSDRKRAVLDVCGSRRSIDREVQQRGYATPDRRVWQLPSECSEHIGGVRAEHALEQRHLIGIQIADGSHPWFSLAAPPREAASWCADNQFAVGSVELPRLPLVAGWDVEAMAIG